MTDILIEVIRTIAVGILCVALYRFYHGENLTLTKLPGWHSIRLGFGLILFGSILDITDNFPDLNTFIIVGDTPTEAFLEKVVGYLLGSVLIGIGMYRWLPELSTTTRQKAQTSESEARLGAVLDTVVDGIITIDERGIISASNPAARRIFGYESHELIGKNVNILMPDPYGKEHNQYLANYRNTSNPKIIGVGREVLGKRKNGKIFPLELAVSEVNFSDERLFTGIVRDISERKENEEELVLARDKAEQATKSKSEFLANMSHEIRTPMNGVLGMLEVLESSDLNPKQITYIESARSAAKTLLTVINDILDFSKIEAGQLHLECIDFNFRKVVEDSTISLAPNATAKGLEMSCFIPVDIPPVLSGDPVRLRQVITNLVSNAVKFTGQGEVDVRVSVAKSNEKNIELRFEVQDTGIGIKKEKQATLFEAFSQADGSTTRNFGGTGLGLSISQQLVHMMKGEIGVVSKSTEGANFWFTANFGIAEKQILPASLLPKNLHVLVVDDHESNRKTLSHYMQSWGIDCATIDSGEGAIALMHDAVKNQTPFEIILLDYNMPGMDGLELAKKIKDDPTLSDAQLIMLSSIGADLQSVQLHEIERYLTKPVKQSDLYDVLAQTIGGNTVRVDDIDKDSLGYPAHFRAMRILLVDDMPTNQFVGKEMLSHTGIEVVPAANGQEAIDAISQQHFDLVLMDCQMPVMDGFTATEIIRTKEHANNTAHLPIVALTAHAMAADREECLAVGMDDYLAKPFERKALLDILSRWLPHKTTNLTPLSEHDEVSKGINIPIDFQKLNDLKKFAGSDFPKLIDSFEKDTKNILATLHVSSANFDTEKMIMPLHSLKGISANMGCTQLFALSQKLEQHARSNTFDYPKEQINNLEKKCLDTIKDLRAYEEY